MPVKWNFILILALASNNLSVVSPCLHFPLDDANALVLVESCWMQNLRKEEKQKHTCRRRRRRHC